MQRFVIKHLCLANAARLLRRECAASSMFSADAQRLLTKRKQTPQDTSELTQTATCTRTACDCHMCPNSSMRSSCVLHMHAFLPSSNMHIYVVCIYKHRLLLALIVCTKRALFRRGIYEGCLLIVSSTRRALFSHQTSGQRRPPIAS